MIRRQVEDYSEFPSVPSLSMGRLSKHKFGIQIRPAMYAFSFNPFVPGTSLAPNALRSPDACSDPGLSTEQSLAPPAMPARADSRLDFICGFGLDFPDEAEEEQGETESDEEDVMEILEEEPMLAEISHIAITGADDSIRKTITTAAQSRVHALRTRYVLRLSATLSLRSVGGRMDSS